VSKGKKRKPGRRIGVVSDTHGLVRPQLLRALEGVDRIIHAGDVGRYAVLHTLGTVAPVVAVRGNMDGGDLGRRLRKTEAVEIGETLLYVVHDLYELDLDPVQAGIRVVISGHSHNPTQKEKNGVLYLNPGSAGPRRFTLPVTMAILHIQGDQIEPEFLALDEE